MKKKIVNKIKNYPPLPIQIYNFGNIFKKWKDGKFFIDFLRRRIKKKGWSLKKLIFYVDYEGKNYYSMESRKNFFVLPIVLDKEENKKHYMFPQTETYFEVYFTNEAVLRYMNKKICTILPGYYLIYHESNLNKPQN